MPQTMPPEIDRNRSSKIGVSGASFYHTIYLYNIYIILDRELGLPNKNKSDVQQAILICDDV